MKKPVSISLTYMLISLLFVWSEMSYAETPFAGAITGGVDLGMQFRDVNGSREKFEEYRDVESGLLINDLFIHYEDYDSPYFMDIKVRDPFQDDEFYGIRAGKRGKFKLNFSYDKIPHNFSKGTLILKGAGNDRLRIADSVQTILQNFEQTRDERGSNPLADTTGEDALAQAVVRDLYNNADDLKFRVNRERTSAEAEYDFSGGIKGWIKLRDYEKRTGKRVIGTGTYERFPQGGSGLGHSSDLFLVAGTELAEPIDYRTTIISTGIGFHKKTWIADLEYTFSDFNNRDHALRWDNPFRITDASATTPTGGVGNASNRGRFAVGQLALPPDSQSHDLMLSGGIDLPLNSRLNASLSYGWTFQNADFLPYTLNSALNSVAGFDVTDPANLPQKDLDGEVNVLSGSLVYTIRPITFLDITAKYRYYDYDNESDQILFPGYAGFGESFWRTVRNDPGAPVENELQSYKKQNADLKATFRIVDPLTFTAEGGWERWDREHRFVSKTDEVSAGGRFNFRPFRIASLMAGYKYSHRTRSEYEPGQTAENPEARGLENFDLAQRKRDKIETKLQLFPMEMLDLGLFFDYERSRYADDARFGLKDARNIIGGVEIAYNPSERVSVYAHYSREKIKNNMNAAAKDDPFDSPATALDDPFADDNFNPLNYWGTDIDEDVDTLGLGVKVQIIPRKLVLDVLYSLSYSEMEFDNFNPNGPVKLANAQAQPWPDIKNKLHEVKLDLSYAFTRNLTAGIRYLYEHYDLDDFRWDIMQPYMAGLSQENSTKFLFTDATYGGYNAHVGGAYLSYRF